MAGLESPADVVVRNLSVRFGPLQALDKVSLVAQRNECLGLVGESGSGKSTVLRIIAGLIAGWEGEISVVGEPVRDTRRPAHLFRRLQMVFQDPYGSLHPRQTVDAILSEPLAIHRLPIHADTTAQALAEVGLSPDLRFRFPHQLSGGQRQRVAIARALMLQPTILLLDEPTSALDVSVQAEILNLLARLRRDHGLTCILVSHNLPVVARLAQRILVLDHGRVVEELTAADLSAGRARSAPAQAMIAAALHRRSLAASPGLADAASSMDDR